MVHDTHHGHISVLQHRFHIIPRTSSQPAPEEIPARFPPEQRRDSDDLCDPNYSEVWPESVEVIIRSEVFPVNDLETSSPVRIENVRIDYMTADGLTPGLASRNEPLGQIVQPDNNVSLNIKVMGTNQKNSFLDDPNDYASLITNNSYYTYHVNLTFSVVEIATDKTGEVATGLTIQVHDFVCAEEGDDNCDDECVHP